jgi:CIC family chloride channel protein
MLVLVASKLVAVSITIGSGGSGGIFAPSLFIGAMLGGAVGTVVHAIWPDSTGSPGAYALVGMGAVVAAGTHAPITAIVIIFELTSDYKIILPLMISCIIATLLATQLQSASIYTLKLIRRGLDIRSGKALNLLESVLVREEMRTDMMTVAPDDVLPALISRFVEHPGNVLFVVDDELRLLGIITTDAIRPAMAETSGLSALVIAGDLMVDSDLPVVKPDDSLADVMKLLARYQGELPVLTEGRMVGVIWPQDVIERYNTELFKRNMASGLVSALRDESEIGVPAGEDAVVAEIPVPGRFVGKTIGDLNIRRQFGFSILMVKRPNAGGEKDLTVTPPPGFAFRSGDLMLVLGPSSRLRALKQGTPGA